MATATSQTKNESGTLLCVLFGVYLLLLTWTVVWKLDVPYVGAAAGYARPWKFVPFVAYGDAGASNPLEVLANVLLFVPFGAYLGLLAPRWRAWVSTCVFAGASLVLELAQHVLSTGSFDITDVIVNTAGGLVGLGLVVLARRCLGARTRTIATRVLAITTVAAILAIAIFVASPVRYQQPRDVIFPSPTATR